jgi:transcriptional regulator with XRE-family HTH domain
MDNPIDGEIIEPGPDQPEQLEFEDPFARFLFPSRPFGELLQNIRERISEAHVAERGGRGLTQAEFGEMLGNVDQVTISRWQTGKQKPQKAQLEKIVALAHEYGLRGLTLARLEQSLNRSVEEYAGIDPRVLRLNTLLIAEDETFKEEFFEVVVAIFHLLKGVRRQGRR